METRALAIAFFYAVGTGVGGITGPLLFGNLIDRASSARSRSGFFIGAAVMAIGGIAELFFGVRAEQRSLEDIAEPLTAEDAGRGSEATAGAPRRAAAPAARAPAPRARARVRWYPGMSMPAQAPAVGHEREIESIVAVLRARGATPARRSRAPVGARRWGPGRFGAAVGAAVREGRIQPQRPLGLRAPARASRAAERTMRRRHRRRSATPEPAATRARYIAAR